MFKLMVTAHTQRGVFYGQLAEDLSESEIEKTLEFMTENINKVNLVVLKTEHSDVILNETILETAVLEFRIVEETEEVPE